MSNKPIGSYELEINTPSRSSYVTGTSRTGMAAGAEENIWLKAGNGTGVFGTPGRKVPGSLGSTGLDVGKPKVPDVPEIGGKGIKGGNDSRLIESADNIIERAQVGNLKRGKNYHGRLPQELEQEILSHPDAVYVTNNAKQNLVYRRGNNVVIVESKGSSRGNIITSYGPEGPRGESGAAIFGGNPSDPGIPVTHEDILNGIKQPGGAFPPATQIK